MKRTLTFFDAAGGSPMANLPRISARGLPKIASRFAAPKTPTGITTNLFGVWGSSASDVWVAGWGGKIAHWNGTAWTNAATGTTNQLLMLSGSGANDVWAAGDSNTLLHWDGVSWKASKHGGYGTFTGVAAISATETWLIGDKSTVLRRKLP